MVGRFFLPTMTGSSPFPFMIEFSYAPKEGIGKVTVPILISANEILVRGYTTSCLKGIKRIIENRVFNHQGPYFWL